MTHTLTLRAVEPVTHNVNRLIAERPDGYTFTPGQATDLTVDKDGWRDETRPFTFTGLPEDEDLEFTIKSYPSHDGVTEQIGKLRAGDTIRIGEPWGAIEDKGPGTFIAGGAGITPFISILRARLARQSNVKGCQLIFANEEERDIILRDEWESMPGLDTVFTVTGEHVANLPNEMVDRDFLDLKVADWHGMFYVCGPKKMVEDIQAILIEKGVEEDRIVVEAA